MTFDFRSVPRVGKLAVTFFPGLVEHSFRHFLEEQGITGWSIGFGAAPKAVQPYARPLGEQDLIDFGVMPEFLGRIERFINLAPMTAEDYYRMTDNSLGSLPERKRSVFL